MICIDHHTPMMTITYHEFQANMHVYLERVFRDREIIKIRDGSRTFVLLGESRPAPASDNIARIGRLRIQARVRPSRPLPRRSARSARSIFAFR
jgi:hypothetical protein